MTGNVSSHAWDPTFNNKESLLITASARSDISTIWRLFSLLDFKCFDSSWSILDPPSSSSSLKPGDMLKIRCNSLATGSTIKVLAIREDSKDIWFEDIHDKGSILIGLRLHRVTKNECTFIEWGIKLQGDDSAMAALYDGLESWEKLAKLSGALIGGRTVL